MHVSLIQLCVGLAWSDQALAFNTRAIDAFRRPHHLRSEVVSDRTPVSAPQARLPTTERRSPGPRNGQLDKRASPYLTSKTEQFVVDGTAIPDVNFDMGESYAGLLPISDDLDETRQLYFWFVPTSNPAATDEVTIWFNGGPGCSSLSGMLTENGPFLWQAGTLAPTPNPYSWSNLTNMLWVEQPVGVGFTQGVPNITNEVELGLEFLGFYRQFVDAFGLQNRKVYLTGR
jgi:carboxypeptidase D